MMHVRQYRPAFFEGFENETKDIDNLEEFFEIPFVKRLTDNGTAEKFIARVYTNDHIIVSATGEGTKFVVAFVTGPDRLKLLELDKKIPPEPHLMAGRQVINNIESEKQGSLPFFCCGSAVIHHQSLVSAKEIKGKAKNRNL